MPAASQTVRSANLGRPSPTRLPTSVMTAVASPIIGTKDIMLTLNARFVAAIDRFPSRPTSTKKTVKAEISAAICRPVGNPITQQSSQQLPIESDVFPKLVFDRIAMAEREHDIRDHGDGVGRHRRQSGPHDP